MTDNNQDTVPRQDLASLFQYIQRLRVEIGAIHKPTYYEYHFDKMGDQLVTIVQARENAGNTIMSTVEENEKLLAHLRSVMDDATKLDIIDTISASNLGLFECCFFQDITGQRITRVVTSLACVEGRVTALIDTLGKTEPKKVMVEPAQKKPRMKDT